MPRWSSVALLAGAAALIALRVFVLDVSTVASGSMRPTLCPGDLLVASKLGSGRVSDGDIVLFPSPTDGVRTVKRVVATGGQRVAIADGRLEVDGVGVDEPYVDQATIDGVYFGPVLVPEGTVFVMGDEREFSVDSRTFGPVPAAAITGSYLMSLPSACSD